DPHGAVGKLDRKRVGQRVIVDTWSAGPQRMRNVFYFVAVAEADLVAEVVLDDAEVIAMILDVGGQVPTVAAAQDDLLAQRRSLPVDFQRQLIRLDQSG